MSGLRARRLAPALLVFANAIGAQQLSRLERSRGFTMLDAVRDDIVKNYFDSTHAGIDVSAVFDSARARIEHANRLEQVLGAIARATLEFNDSHTAFIPPTLVYVADCGWDMRFVGDTCRILRVRPGSDAEAKGMHLGDALLAVSGIPLTRQNVWRLRYALTAIQPRPELRVSVQSPGSNPRELDIASKVIERRRIMDPNSSFDFWEMIREGESAWENAAPRYIEVADRVVVWRVHSFYPYTSWADDIVKRARNREAVVLDLRGNLGGATTSLLRLTGQFYEKDLIVATEVERKKREMMIAKGSGKDRYQGALVVLVDAESASSSEIFARTVQLPGRGKVIGDRTAGAVRGSMTYIHSLGTQTVAFYGVSVTVADLVMPDGGKLENAGVMPDEVVLPTGEDIAAGRDPALARALTFLGIPITAKEAGAFRDRK